MLLKKNIFWLTSERVNQPDVCEISSTMVCYDLECEEVLMDKKASSVFSVTILWSWDVSM